MPNDKDDMGALTATQTQGRELGLRIVTSVILLSVFAIVYAALPRWVLWLVFAVVWMVALSEWLSLASVRLERQAIAFIGWGVVALWIAYHPEYVWIWVGAGCLFWTAVAAVLIIGPWRSWLVTLMSKPGLSALLSMSVLWMAYAGLIAFGYESHALLLVLMIVWLSDSLAYLIGRRWGRHKLIPAISPGKSWEGFFGGLIGVVLVVMIGTLSIHTYSSLWHYCIVAGFLSVVCVLGDCFESALKRVCRVKDSARFLPGHGGVLDRIDGLIAVLPFGALFKLFGWIYKHRTV